MSKRWPGSARRASSTWMGESDSGLSMPCSSRFMAHSRAGRSAISQPVNAPERRWAALVGLQRREPVNDRPVGPQEEAAGAAGRVADAVAGLGPHHIHDRRDQRPRGEVLACAPGALLGGLLDQALVGGALEVGVVAEPLVLVDEVLDELLELGRGLDPVAGFAEDHPEHVVARPQRGQGLAVVGLQLGARAGQQRLPVELDGHHPLAAQQIVLLVGHLQEQQIGELLQIVAIGQPVIAQHITELPKPLHQRLRIGSGHSPTLRLRQTSWRGSRCGSASPTTPAASSRCRGQRGTRSGCIAFRGTVGVWLRRSRSASTDEALRALRQIEAQGLTQSEAVRSSLVHEAARIRDRRALAAEVAALEADADDRAEMSTVASLMEQLRAPR